MFYTFTNTHSPTQTMSRSSEDDSASDTCWPSPDVDLTAEESAAWPHGQAPSCGEVKASEAWMALRYRAQCAGFNEGWILGTTCRPYADQDPDDDGDNSPVLPAMDWEPYMYHCYKYASKKSGNSVYFEDNNGNVIKVIRAWPISGWPRRTARMSSWLSTNYVPLLGPYEVRVSPGDFPVINCRGKVRERERDTRKKRKCSHSDKI